MATHLVKVIEFPDANNMVSGSTTKENADPVPRLMTHTHTGSPNDPILKATADTHTRPRCSKPDAGTHLRRDTTVPKRLDRVHPVCVAIDDLEAGSPKSMAPDETL